MLRVKKGFVVFGEPGSVEEFGPTMAGAPELDDVSHKL